MYTQIIYFVIALLLYSFQEPGSRSFYSPAETLLGLTVGFSLFTLISYLSFKSLARTQLSIPQLTARYHRLQARLSVLALMALAADVYILDIKYYLQALSWVNKSLTISSVFGISLYMSYLIIIWYLAYPTYRKIYSSTFARHRFIRRNLRLYNALLVPWLLVSLLSDLLEWVPLPGPMESPYGQILLFGLLAGLFLCLAPPLVIQLWGCKPIPPSPVRTQLELFCRNHNFRLGNLLYWPVLGEESLTAAILGILPKLRYVLFSQGLLDILNEEELKAVIAHEMGHVRNYHIMFYLLFFTCYMIFLYCFFGPLKVLLLKQPAVLDLALSSDKLSQTLFSLLLGVPGVVLVFVYFRYLFGFFLRNSERQADLYALTLIGHPFTLISSLRKIAIYSGSPEDLPSWHHFSIAERVEYLRRCYQNPEMIKNHNRKLYGMASGFLVLWIILSAVGLRWRQSNMVHMWQKEVELSLLQHEYLGNLDNPQLCAIYGGMLLEAHQYEKAEEVLTRALKAMPDDPEVLNNLAWLYATAPPPYRRPEKALKLALRAAALSAAPYILDTLAEAYYANGNYQEALCTIRKAIAKHPKELGYYLKQERKFLKAFRCEQARAWRASPSGVLPRSEEH